MIVMRSFKREISKIYNCERSQKYNNFKKLLSSLFDSPNERYVKLMNNIKPFIIIQFGLTAFQHIREQNTYSAETFCFYLLPRSIPSKNRHFVWQISSLEFLTIYNFDFNKVSILKIRFDNFL